MAPGKAEVQGPLKRRRRPRAPSGAWLEFFAANAALSALLSAGYFQGASPGPRELAYITLIWCSHFGSLYLALAAVAWLACRPFASPRARRGIVVTLLAIFQIALATDVVIYGLFRYHLNAWVLTVVLTAIGDSVHLGASTTGWIVGAIGAILGAEAGLAWWLSRRASRRRAGGRPALGPARVAGVILALVAVDKGLYAWQDLHGEIGVLRYTKLLPHYRPFTVKNFVFNRFGFRTSGIAPERLGVRDTMLAYPPAERLGCAGALRLATLASGRRPNVLIIAVESLRADMLSPEVMPNLWKFSRECRVYRRHYSGGNLTRAGLFSLFYGLPGTYWKTFLAERRGPVLLDALQEAGYRMKILSSTRFTFPPFRLTAFVNVRDAVEDELPGEDARARDPVLAARLLAWLDAAPRREKPFFAFLFPDGPHTPYMYPPEFARFAPAADHINYLTLHSVTDPAPIFNRYRNAVYFDDHVLGTVLDGLRARGLLDSTLIIITGDHGEGFNEHGYWGHSNAFADEQIRVPMLVRAPGAPPVVIREMTSHMDVPATVLGYLGCRADPSLYSTGRSLLAPRAREHIVVTSYQESAIVRPDGTAVILPGETFMTSAVEVRDPAYRQVPGGPAALKPHAAALAEVLREMNRFLR